MGIEEPPDWQIPALTERLGALPHEKCALFAGTCAAHAISMLPTWIHEHAATRQRDSRQGTQQLQASLDRLLGWVTRQEGDAIAELQKLLKDCLPDPAHLFLGEIELFVVVRRSWECVASGTDVEDRVWRARQAAVESYVVLTPWYITRCDSSRRFAGGRVARVEARLREPICLAELQFQCAVLCHVEQLTITPDLAYRALFASVTA